MLVEHLKSIIVKSVNFETLKNIEFLISLILTIIAASFIGYRLKINRCKIVLSICILMAILSSLYTQLFYENTGYIIGDIAFVFLPILLIVGFVGIILIFRDDSELLDLRMLVAVWCIWGSGFIATLATLQLYAICIITILFVLFIKFILHTFYNLDGEG